MSRFFDFPSNMTALEVEDSRFFSSSSFATVENKTMHCRVSGQRAVEDWQAANHTELGKQLFLHVLFASLCFSH